MIVHVYSGNLFGGIEANLLALATADRTRPDGRSPSHVIALSFDGTLAERLRNLDAKPYILGPVRFRYPWTTWQARRRLAALLSGADVDGVVAHGSWAYKLTEPVARRAGVPLAFWNHDPFRGQGPLEGYVVARPPDLVIANSRYTAAALEKALGRQVDAVIHPVSQHRTVVDPESARSTIRFEFGTPADAVVILLFSRFERLKGHSVLLEALAKLADLTQWRCWLVGGIQKPDEIAYVSQLKSLAESAGISDRVRFVGHRDDIPALLAAADIHCQPNIGPDSFGLTYVEALAAGLPSVGSDLGGVPEILTPDCGRLVPPGDAEALAETLRELVADKELRIDLGAHGPQRARSLCDPLLALEHLESTFEAFRSGRGSK
jgi:glycosyltransferase involved in cell wall biosynthesis